jgi:hypothetical protein
MISNLRSILNHRSGTGTSNRGRPRWNQRNKSCHRTSSTRINPSPKIRIRRPPSIQSFPHRDPGGASSIGSGAMAGDQPEGKPRAKTPNRRKQRVSGTIGYLWGRWLPEVRNYAELPTANGGPTAQALHRRAILEAKRELPSNQCYELLHGNQAELPNRFSGTQHWWSRESPAATHLSHPNRELTAGANSHCSWRRTAGLRGKYQSARAGEG